MINHYQIDFGKKIDEGSFSKIYQGIDKDGNTVVCKIVDKKYFNVFETSIMRCIDHPNILHADYIQTMNDKIYIISKKMAGNIVDGRFRVAQRKDMCFQILQGLYCLHREGYIHADLKCENILYLGDGPEVKICDFNISLPIKTYDHIICTPVTRAPEVFLGEKWGEEVDIWSLACVFYQIMFRKPLFRIDTCPSGEDKNVHIVRQIMYFMKAFTGESTEKFERRKFTSTPIEIEDALFTQQNLESFRDLLRKMFKINPKERITLLGIINHKFFDSFRKAENRGMSTYKVFSFPNKLDEDRLSNIVKSLMEVTQNKIPEKFILNIVCQVGNVNKNEDELFEFLKKLIKCIFGNRGMIQKENIEEFEILSKELNKIEYMLYLPWK